VRCMLSHLHLFGGGKCVLVHALASAFVWR
jgi:hypothetical protein